MEHPHKLLKKLHISPLRKLGQNFLTSNNHLSFLETYLTKVENHHLLEIGPGFGAVTEFCLKYIAHIYVCEKDRTLCQYLKSQFAYKHQIQVIEEDFLNLDNEFFTHQKIHTIIGNLPFNITSAIIIHIVLHLPNVQLCILGVQEEFADRIIDQKLSSIAVLLKVLGDVKIERKINNNNFYPRPTVNVTWFSWSRNYKIHEEHIIDFEHFIKILFWGKRKKIKTSLKNHPDTPLKWLKKIANIQDGHFLYLIEQRPDNLQVTDFIDIFYFVVANVVGFSSSESLSSTF